jgi:hypothetical protein
MRKWQIHDHLFVKTPREQRVEARRANPFMYSGPLRDALSSAKELLAPGCRSMLRTNFIQRPFTPVVA